jgi:hypothetical protein
MRGQAVNSRDMNGSAYLSEIATGLSTENFIKIEPQQMTLAIFFC